MMFDRRGTQVRAGARVSARLLHGTEHRWTDGRVVSVQQHAYTNPRTGWETFHWTATIEHGDPPRHVAAYSRDLEVMDDP